MAPNRRKTQLELCVSRLLAKRPSRSLCRGTKGKLRVISTRQESAYLLLLSTCGSTDPLLRTPTVCRHVGARVVHAGKLRNRQKLHVRLKRIRMPSQPHAGARCRAERIAPELQGQGILLLRVRIPGRAASGWQVSVSAGDALEGTDLQHRLRRTRVLGV